MKPIIVITLSSILALSACQTTKDRPITVTRQTPETIIPPPPKPRPIITRKVKITVLDEEGIKALLADPNFRRIIGLSEKDYANLANNYQEAIRFIEAQGAIIEYYEKVIKELQERKLIKVENVSNR